MIKAGKGGEAAIEIIVAFSHDTFPKDLMYFPGTQPYKAPGRRRSMPPRSTTIRAFTAFIGYEWTSNTGGNNLHRNVIFRDDGDKASQVEPFTVYPPDGQRQSGGSVEVDGRLREKTGGSVLAIAHNGNLSNGLMFPMVEAFGKKLDRDYVETRAKWERLYEATQTKGDRRSPSVPVAE